MRPKHPRIYDLNRLDPTFRERVEEVIKRMNERKFDAIVWETFRTRERADMLAATGTGIRDSMHCYGLAVDIISHNDMWDAPKEFWDALGEEYETMAIVWGGRFKNRGLHGDRPHGQAVTVEQEHFVRHATPEQIVELVKKNLDISAPSMRATRKDKYVSHPPIAKEVVIPNKKDPR
jgi:hypothetical protein